MRTWLRRLSFLGLAVAGLILLMLSARSARTNTGGGALTPSQQDGRGVGRRSEFDFLPQPDPGQIRRAVALAKRSYFAWYREKLPEVYDCLSPASTSRNMFRGDRQKVLRAMAAWRKHIKETKKLPRQISPSHVKRITRGQAKVLAALLLAPRELDKLRTDANLLDRKFVLLTYQIDKTSYVVGCYRSATGWGLLNDPLTLETPKVLQGL